MEVMAARWFGTPAFPVIIQSLEDVARLMLIRLLNAHDPWLDRILFDYATRRFVAESLMGTFCAWGINHGSFLFWSCRDGRLGRFVEVDQCLMDGDIKIPITRQALLEGLTAKAIMPGVFLSLMMSSYLPGLAVAGGPKQPAYYRAMIEVANAAGSLHRGPELSTYGYWCVDMTSLTPNRTDTIRIPAAGAGLSLANGACDAAWLCEQLALCPILPVPPMPSYD
jgi:hypothetical protein